MTTHQPIPVENPELSARLTADLLESTQRFQKLVVKADGEGFTVSNKHGLLFRFVKSGLVR